MRDKYVGWLLSMAAKQRGVPMRILALAFGATLFLVVIAWLLLAAASWLAGIFIIVPPAWLDISVAAAGLGGGGLFLIWSAWSQWDIGGGTPNPAAPTQKLIIRGPYKYCRNPLQLGAMLYYLGVGALVCDTVVGALMFLIAFILGSPYHHYVEEKELAARFGIEYEEYRRKTPFIIPRLFGARK